MSMLITGGLCLIVGLIVGFVCGMRAMAPALKQDLDDDIL